MKVYCDSALMPLKAGDRVVVRVHVHGPTFRAAVRYVGARGGYSVDVPCNWAGRWLAGRSSGEYGRWWLYPDEGDAIFAVPDKWRHRRKDALWRKASYMTYKQWVHLTITGGLD